MYKVRTLVDPVKFCPQLLLCILQTRIFGGLL